MDTQDTVSVRVELTVTEEVTYEFPVTVEVPADAADDPEALAQHLAENDGLWIDDLPVTGGDEVILYVNERSVDRVTLLSHSEAA
ncbi:MAG TPA: hypothetical protein VIU15_35195 [Streptomyces sp.]